MWELWLPLLIVAATVLVGALLYFAGKKLLFDPRHREHPEELHKGTSH